MTNKILNMIFKATDKVTPVIDDIKGEAGGTKGIGGITSALQGLIGPATIAAGSIVIVGGAVADMMRDWQDHVIGISDFADVLGISTEEASALNGIAGDFNITQGDMLTVMENLVKNGLDPTVDGLIAAKDLIFESEDPTKRLTTAMDLLGKKGAEDLIPMFNTLTDDELKDYLQYMDDSAVITQEMVDKARDQEAAMDDLAGAWAGLKSEAMGWAAPGLTALIELLTTPFGADSAAAFINKFFGLGPSELSLDLNVHDYTFGGGGIGGGGGGFPESIGGGGGGGGGWTGPQEFQTGGGFTIPGFGGPDSTRVSFMGTPGEEVSVGGGTSDMQAILAEIRRIANMLPLAISDAVERVM